jgi:hypothetical protein
MPRPKAPPTLTSLIDDLDRIRQELMSIQHSLENMETPKPPLSDGGDSAGGRERKKASA